MDFTFSTQSSSVSGYSPLSITFKPSNIALTGSRFISKMVYQFPEKTVTKVNTFTPDYTEVDCRADFTYVVPANNTTCVINISAYIGPDQFTPTTYSLTATNILPKFTRNPLASAYPYAFGEVHLLKVRAWGPDNSQMVVLETKDPNYLLLNYGG